MALFNRVDERTSVLHTLLCSPYWRPSCISCHVTLQPLKRHIASLNQPHSDQQHIVANLTAAIRIVRLPP